MILRSIEVQGWRCLSNACRLGPFGEGLNIVHAPNGTGKSTVFEALLRGFFDGHRVSGEGAERIRPWGREVTPTVAIEFAHGGTEYRLVKRFLADRTAELLRQENGEFVSFATGQAADAQARAILAGEAPGAGMTRDKHWGLAQVLWVPQGKSLWSELPGNLVGSIRSSLGLQTVDSASSGLEQAIRQRFEDFFTPSGGVKKGAGAPAWIAWEKELEMLHPQRAEWERKLREFDETSRRIEDLRARRDHAAREECAAIETLAKARDEARHQAALIAEKQRADAEAARFAAEHHALENRVAQLRERSRDAAAKEAEIASLQAGLPALEQQAAAYAAAEDEAVAALQRAEEMHRAVEETRDLAEQAERYLHAREESFRLDKLCGQIGASAEHHAQLLRELATLVAPTSSALRAIRAALAQQSEIQAQLDASMITLEVTPDRDAVLEVRRGEPTGERALVAGERVEIRGAPEVSVRLAGLATIRARGPAGSAEELRTKAGTAARKVEELTHPFGSPVLARLEELHEFRAQKEKDIATAEARLTALRGSKTHEEFLQDHAHHEAAVRRFLALHPAWETAPPDDAALRANHDTRRIAAPDVARAGIQRNAAHTATLAARHQAELSKNNAQNGQSQLDGLRRQIAALNNDGLDEPRRADALGTLALQWSAARGALAEAHKKLAALPGDPAGTIHQLEARAAELRQRAQQLLADEERSAGRLHGLAEEAPYAGLAQCEETMARLEFDVARDRAKSDAIKLLHDTVAACRAELLTGMTAPVETRALQILQRIAGPHLAGLGFAENLALSHVSPASHGSTVHPENLSGGEQEQVHLAVRLALAQVLAGEERQLVVLDDVLMATDAGRLARALTVLEELADHLQIVILTCHPERYFGLRSDTRRFDLEAIRLG